MGTNDLRTTRNLDFVLGEVYALVTTAKRKLPNCRLVLSEVLQSSDVSRSRIGALNDGYGWVANALGLTFVDPNTWLEEGDFERDGLHLLEEGKDDLDNYMLEILELILEDRQGVKCDKIWKTEITARGIPGKPDDH
jgi:hypothetical protein